MLPQLLVRHLLHGSLLSRQGHENMISLSQSLFMRQPWCVMIIASNSMLTALIARQIACQDTDSMHCEAAPRVQIRRYNPPYPPAWLCGGAAACSLLAAT